MKCLVLAAGYATRLYPLTENFPKPLLKIGEKTILDWLIDDLEQTKEIDQYIVISNHKYAVHFEKWAKSKKELTEKIYILDDGTSSNETRLGAVMDIQFAIEKLKLHDELLVIAGDNVLDFSLAQFVQYTKRKKTSCIMRYFEPSREKLLKCGVVIIDEQEQVLQMTEKSPNPATNWCCPPFYYYTKEDAKLVAQAIADGGGIDAPGSLVSWICQKSKVHAMEMPGKRYDIGNLESYERVRKEYKGIQC